jgi:hypothetical protein
MVTFTASAAVDANNLVGAAELADPLLLTFSNEGPGGFTGTLDQITLEVRSSPANIDYLSAFPISGTITHVVVILIGVVQYTISGLSIDLSTAVTNPTLLSPSAILAGPDVIDGSAFADVLMGFGGNDTINGGGGNDTLIGGPGKDRLTGGSGADKFVFTATSDSKVGPNHDTITDFKHSQHDKIDLGGIDADQRPGHPGNQAFVYIGSDTFAHYHALHPSIVGMVRFVPATHLVQGNVDAALAADFEIALPHVASLSAGDFVL